MRITHFVLAVAMLQLVMSIVLLWNARRRNKRLEHLADARFNELRLLEMTIGNSPVEIDRLGNARPRRHDGQTLVTGDTCQSVILCAADPNGDPYDRLMNSGRIPDLLAQHETPFGPDAEREFHAGARRGLRGPELVAWAMAETKRKRRDGARTVAAAGMLLRERHYRERK